MKAIKSRGGMTRGRGMTESVRLQWVHTMHIFAQINEAMSQITKTKSKTSEQHVDIRTARRERDEKDIQTLLEWLKIYNHFIQPESTLMNIFTGITDENRHSVNCDTAEEVGYSIFLKMDNWSFKEVKFKRNDQVSTLKSLNNAINLEVEVANIDPSILFSRLLILAEKSNDVKYYFNYELPPVPTSLFKDQKMRKINTADLSNHLIANITYEEDIPKNAFYVLDGGALLHHVKWAQKSTYQEVITQYKYFILKRYGTSIIVFDGYQGGPSTKDHEDFVRKKKSSANIKVTGSEIANINQLMTKTNVSLFHSCLKN